MGTDGPNQRATIGHRSVASWKRAGLRYWFVIVTNTSFFRRRGKTRILCVLLSENDLSRESSSRHLKALTRRGLHRASFMSEVRNIRLVRRLPERRDLAVTRRNVTQR
jgi:DNA-binding transcriptional ArsR family regulator